jgi:hypothetical protein
MANDLVNKSVSIYIDDAPAREAYDRLVQKADSYNKKIDEGTRKAEFLNRAIQKSLDAGGKPEALQKKLEGVNSTLDKNRKELDKVTVSQKNLQQQIDSKTGPSLKQQEALVRKLENEYKNMAHNTQEAVNKLKELGNASSNLTKMRQRLDEVKSAQASASTGTNGFFNSFLGNVAAIGVAKVTQVVTNFFGGVVDEADQAITAVDNLTVALENAGSKELLQSFLDDADALADKYKRLDNDDITGVFTKLVDYGKLTKKQINEVTDVIINYAAKQRISLGEATDVVTKALEGSAKGLKIYGINLSEAKTVTERYNIVVDQLGKKVAGAEAAFEQTPKGIREIFMQSIRDAQEAVGKFLYSLSGIEKQSYNNAVAAKKEAETGQVLIDRYEELSKKTNKTAAEKEELKRITSQLVGIFGNSIVEINKETGALTLNVQAH